MFLAARSHDSFPSLKSHEDVLRTAPSFLSVMFSLFSRNDNDTDDSAFILKVFADCAEDSVMTFTEANYSAYTPMSFMGWRNVTIYLNGNLNLPDNISQTYATPWFYFSGPDVQLIESESDEWGRFNGFGQQWWDTGNRLATFNVTNGILRGFNVIKPNYFVDAKPDNGTKNDSTSFPFNTRVVSLVYYGHNGDDCVPVVNGVRDVLAQNGFCGFLSHGLSIGSLGKNGAVQTVENIGAVHGARFKSWTSGRGYTTNGTWEDINPRRRLNGYYDQDKGARPENTNQTSTQISNFTYKYFMGTLAKNWTQAIIFDLFPGTALSLSFSGINVTPNDTSKETTVICSLVTLAEGE
ncbi:pectin lyase fold/virulence factor [Desarmillaria ectypa]|nr:pectin lyase fold/virulence factor [Desarmillaria ectypa]